MTPEQKAWIDKASYKLLLNKWRFAPVGDPLFQGEAGEYYQQVMNEKKAAISHADAIKASKSVGWEA